MFTNEIASLEIKKFALEGEDETVSLTAYVAAKHPDLPYNDKRPGILVIPGGGYAYCSNREAEPIALAFLAAGYNAFILAYNVNNRFHKGRKFPAQLIEAAKAIKLIRDRAEEFGTNPERVFVIGFSAGGHLAASIGTMYDSKFVHDAIDVPRGYVRPTGMLLCYAVLDSGEYAHRGSIDNILHEDKDDPESLELVALQNRVDENTVPAFLWHTRTDTTVPVQNSILFAKALADKGVGFEMHIYPSGGHGASLANELVGCNYPVLTEWLGEALRWMKSV